MKWTKKEENKLKALYTSTKIPIEKIAKIIGRSVPALNLRLSKLRVKRRYPRKFKYPSKITPTLARIHAHVCGDGYLCVKREKDIYGPWAKYRRNPVRKKYMVGYCNNNQELLKEFQQDVFEVFGLKGQKVGKNEIRVSSKKLWQFLKEMGAGDSHSWSIPDSIINGSKEIQRNWLRAFFDDEADFDDNGRIRVKIVNKKGLIQVMKMLKRFVSCHLAPKKGFYWGKTVCLNINKKDVPKFFSKIGSVRYPSPRKIYKSRNSPG
jgi:predicted Rdx family selenoprotein